MTGLLLIAETPRAGRLGHRVLVPIGCNTAPNAITGILQAAASEPEGEDYLAVRRRVEQRLPNGSIRQGLEMIVLFGVCLREISWQQRNALRESLEQRLADLETLTDGADWDESGQSVIVEKRELAEWLNLIWDARLPQVSKTDHMSKPQPFARQKHTPAARHIMIAGIALTAIVSVSLWYGPPVDWLRRLLSQGTATAPATQRQPSTQLPPEPLRDRITLLAQDLSADPELLVKSLYWSAFRKQNNDEAPEPQPGTDIWSRISGNATICEDIEKAIGESNIDYYAFLGEAKSKDLADFTKTNVGSSVQDIRRARVVLGTLCCELLTLKERFEKDDLPNNDELAPLFITLRDISPQDIEQVHKHAWSQEQPFFDEADWKVVDTYKTILIRLAAVFPDLSQRNDAALTLDDISEHYPQLAVKMLSLRNKPSPIDAAERLRSVSAFLENVKAHWDKYNEHMSGTQQRRQSGASTVPEVQKFRLRLRKQDEK